jgi:hypothetical protein
MLLVRQEGRMILTKLKGGLGNQMFQYAAGRRLSLAANGPLKLDTSSYGLDEPSITKRAYELGAFSIEASIASPEEIARLARFRPGRRRNIVRNVLFADASIYRQEKKIFRFDPEVLKPGKDIYLDGYWQSWKYAEPIHDVLARELALREPMQEYYRALAAQARSTESVAVHVRRQDYVTNSGASALHGALPLTYYQEAAKVLAAKGVQDPTYFIFSDDIPWCRKNIRLDGPLVFCEAPLPFDAHELVAMSACRHFIIANSSFSWWGAWLGSHPNKVVAAPHTWLNKDVDTSDLTPPSWERL